MSYTAEELLVLATDFEQKAVESLEKFAKEKLDSKKKDKKKKPPFWLKNKDYGAATDPKAKVRNRGTVCVPAESAKDKKDHFPINDEAQARNALARVNQYSSVPDWYSGSLQSLINTVTRKVHSKYPGIKQSPASKKPGKG